MFIDIVVCFLHMNPLGVITSFHTGTVTFSNLKISIVAKELEKSLKNIPTQPAFTCSKLTSETVEQGVKHVQS